jgi:N-acetylglucosamine-6-phosphate deacetylase
MERLGDIEVGYSADMVILDKSFRVIKTIVNGEIVYEK